MFCIEYPDETPATATWIFGARENSVVVALCRYGQQKESNKVQKRRNDYGNNQILSKA